MMLDFSRCRNVWVPDDSEAGGFWSPPPPHVKYGVEQIIKHPYFLLADDMGGMKTAQSIIAAQLLHDAGIIDRVIVIAPASVRPKVWFDVDLGQLREQVFEDKHNFVTEYHAHIKKWEHGPLDKPELKWIITNFEYIRTAKNLNTLLPYCGPKTFLILDESSAVRTYDSAQTEACMKLRWKTNAKGRPILGMPRCGRILLMNGTPIAESPMDMFSQCNLMHPSILDCRYITLYKSRYAVQIPVLGAGGRPLESPYPKRERQPDGSVKLTPQHIVQVSGWTNLDDLQKRCAPYVLRREAKDLGINFALPPVALEVRLTESTWKYYKDMRDELCVWLESNVATASTAAIKVLRLAQITSGFLGGIEDANVGEEYHEGDVLNLPGSFLDGIKLQGEGAKALNKQAAYFNNKEWDYADLMESIDGHNNHTAALDSNTVSRYSTQRVAKSKAATVRIIGREKLDFALSWHADLLQRYPDLKLLAWCRFVPELKRYLEEVQKFGHPVGAACGQAILGGTKREEREAALRLLHPKTAPKGACTVGATQGTGAIGLNFTACRTVLDISYDFSPWKKLQGDARVNRPGQTGPVSFFYLIAVGPRGQKTIDHHVMLTRLGKMQINDLTTKGWVRLLKEE